MPSGCHTVRDAAGVFKGKRAECLSVTRNRIDHVGGVHCPRLWCQPVDSAEGLPWPQDIQNEIRVSLLFIKVK